MQLFSINIKFELAIYGLWTTIITTCTLSEKLLEKNHSQQSQQENELHIPQLDLIWPVVGKKADLQRCCRPNYSIASTSKNKIKKK